jgi:hypothetical protein
VTVYVATRPGLDAGPINKAAHDKIAPELRIAGQPPLLAGPKADLVLQGTKVIEGTVTDAQTGKPMPGVMVTSGSGYNNHVEATADKDGKYRLTGLVKNREYLIHTLVRDEKTTPYLMWSARVKDTEGLTPIRHDIRMTKGVVVTGRLIDRQTGKAVDGSVRLAPLPDNKYFGTTPAYNSYSSERFSHPVEKGKFRVVTIPGRSLLMAQAHDKGETLGGKPVPGPAGEQAVLGVFFEQLLRDGGLPIGCRRDDEPLHRLDVPACADEFSGEPVEQFRVAREFASDAEVLDGLDQPGTEVHLPPPIDGDPGGERIGRVHQPLGEVQARSR